MAILRASSSRQLRAPSRPAVARPSAVIQRRAVRQRLVSGSGRALQSGFSLMEIIIVTILIGGIVTFAARQILGGSDKAKYNLASAQIETLAQKVHQYEMDTGTLPATLDDLVRQPGNISGWLGPYAKADDIVDPWKTPIEYRAPGESQRFDLISLGADRKAGGSSVDGDIRYE